MRLNASILLCLWAAACPCPASTAAPPPPPTPGEMELPEQLQPAVAVSAAGMVVSGCPEASRAGAEILAAGGNAVDAAVAAALTLGVAEPGQSGLGGQTYMLICLRDGRRVAVDGSCVAPLRVSRPALQRLSTEGRQFGHQLAAAPGTLAALAHALERYGTMPLSRVIAPAIAVADAGSRFTANQLHFLEAYVEKVREDEVLANLFLQDRLFLWGLEHVYCQPALATTLRRIAAAGAGDFYRGAIADEIEADMAARGGFVRKDDLGRVRPSEREPLRGCYRDLEVVTFPLPGGGAVLLEALNILEQYPLEALREPGDHAWFLTIEAGRLAMADEQALTTSSPEAVRHALGAQHATERAALIGAGRALVPLELGEQARSSWGDRDTTHLSVADAAGNVVALTQTLGNGFGACVAASSLGFPYNCMLAAFDLTWAGSRAYLLPLRAPYTSMAPTVLFRRGRPFLVLGGVGTGRLIPSLVLTIANVADRGMALPDAVAAPRVLWSEDGSLYAEMAGPITDELIEALRGRGYASVVARRFPLPQAGLGWQGCVNAIAIDPDGTLTGVGDSRRQGTAAAPD